MLNLFLRTGHISRVGESLQGCVLRSQSILLVAFLFRPVVKSF